MAVVLAANVAAPAGSSAFEEFRSGLIQASVANTPDPDKCGPSGIAWSATWKGRDTLGGAFEMSFSHCSAPSGPDSGRVFDQEGHGRYILTGEEWTMHGEDYIAVSSPFPRCIERPEEPVEFTVSHFTGDHAGGWVHGHLYWIGSTYLCGGIPSDPIEIAWFEGAFVPQSCGIGFELALLLPVLMGLRRHRLY
jgi:hypothetical protein